MQRQCVLSAVQRIHSVRTVVVVRLPLSVRGDSKVAIECVQNEV